MWHWPCGMDPSGRKKWASAQTRHKPIVHRRQAANEAGQQARRSHQLRCGPSRTGHGTMWHPEYVGAPVYAFRAACVVVVVVVVVRAKREWLPAAKDQGQVGRTDMRSSYQITSSWRRVVRKQEERDPNRRVGKVRVAGIQG